MPQLNMVKSVSASIWGGGGDRDSYLNSEFSSYNNDIKYFTYFLFQNVLQHLVNTAHQSIKITQKVCILKPLQFNNFILLILYPPPLKSATYLRIIKVSIKELKPTGPQY
jgi:hypothetical protein